MSTSSELLRSLAPLWLGALLLLAAPAEAGVLAPGWGGEVDEERLIYCGDYDIVAATILAVRDSGATQANPPRVTIRVERVFRGNVAPGVQEIEWLPVPLYMPCPTGEEELLRTWGATPLAGPTAGRHMILGGERSDSRLWGCSVFVRWDDSDSLRRVVVDQVRKFRPCTEERRLAEKTDREREAQRDREMRARAADQLRTKTHAWYEREKAVRRQAKVEELVESSDFILTATVSPRSGWVNDSAHYLQLGPVAWMTAPPVSESTRTTPTVWLGHREFPIFDRWSTAPRTDGPGGAPGASPICLAFLRFVHEPTGGVTSWPIYRPTDASSGIILADDRLLRQVREAIARRGEREILPRTSCSTNLTDFLVSDSLAATDLAIKITDVRLGAPRTPSLVLACLPGEVVNETAVNPGWFAPCALPDSQYLADYKGQGWGVLIRRSQMKALIDSLATIPALSSRRVDSADSIVLSLRRASGAGDEFYECTLDAPSLRRLVRTMNAVFHEVGDTRSNVSGWSVQMDRGLSEIWNQGRAARRKAMGLGADVGPGSGQSRDR